MGIGPDTAPPPLIALDKTRRLYYEAAFAKICGACPIPPSNGKTTRHRLTKWSTARATPLHRIVIVR